jgi:hypothetical protein
VASVPKKLRKKEKKLSSDWNTGILERRHPAGALECGDEAQGTFDRVEKASRRRITLECGDEAHGTIIRQRKRDSRRITAFRSMPLPAAPSPIR